MTPLMLALLTAPPPFADPVTGTLALVPPDAAIVLVVRDARRHSEALAASPFAGWVKGRPGGVTATAQFAALAAGAKLLSGVLGVTPEEFLGDVVGDAVVLSFTPAGPDRPEVGVVYVWPRRPATLRRLADKLAELQLASGELTSVEVKVHAGMTYSARRKPGGGADYLAERGGVFAVTSHEPTARDFLTRGPDPTHSERLKGVGAQAALAVVLFGPRAFDAELESRRRAAADPGEAAFLAQFNRAWGALDAIAVSVTPGVGLEFALAATFRAEALPAEFRDLTPPAAPGAGRTPAGALASADARLSLTKLIRLGKSFLAAAGREQFDAWLAGGVGPAVGRDRLPRLVEALGPRVSFAVLPPPAGSPLPAWRLAVDLRDATGDAQSALADGLAVFAQFVRYDYNSKHADQLTLTTAGGVTTATGAGLPAGLVPSYAVRPDGVAFASRPELLAATGEAAKDAPLVRVDAPAVADSLRANRAGAAAWLARQNGNAADDAARELDALCAALDALRSLELRPASTPNSVRLTLSIEFVRPLADSR